PLRYAGPADDQRHPLALLVEEVLELNAVGAQLEAVVGGEDEEGLALVAVFFDQPDDPLHLVVDGEEALQPTSIAAVEIGDLLIGQLRDVLDLLRLVVDVVLVEVGGPGRTDVAERA